MSSLQKQQHIITQQDDANDLIFLLMSAVENDCIAYLFSLMIFGVIQEAIARHLLKAASDHSRGKRRYPRKAHTVVNHVQIE
jgi:hypothetical protein